MNLEQEYLATLDILHKEPIHFSSLLAISLLDLTSLDAAASNEVISQLQEKAETHQVAALCVFPHHLENIQSANGVCKRATVVNFPHGQDTIEKTLDDMEHIISCYHPDEIDYVFPYQQYLNGENKQALTHCHQAATLCQQNNKRFKVILETGAFKSAETIYQLSQEVITTGCDFLKTSTGFTPIGATPLAAFCMLKAIKESRSQCGIKVSGGIKKTDHAFLYMHLANHMLNRPVNKSWFRIGASSLLEELLASSI
jgi:deoxyribose-phosphate aldolase